MIKFDQVTYGYPMPHGERGGNSVIDVSLEIAPASLTCMVGPNGAGKSTLVKLANGILTPTKGSVVVDGISTSDDDASHVRQIRQLVGVVGQDPAVQVVASTVFDDCAFGPCNLALPEAEVRSRVSEALQLCGLSGFEKRDPNTLSGGELQRLALAGVLALKPQYLFFDEAGSMLDAPARRDLDAIIAAARSQGVAVVRVTHEAKQLLHADQILVLEEGRAVFLGTPQAFFADSQLVETSGVSTTLLMQMAQHARRWDVLEASSDPQRLAALITQRDMR